MSSDHESKSLSRLAALQWPIILTLGVILFLSVVSGVFYLYILDREGYYNERYFRLLHAEAEGVSLKIENYREVIYSAAELGRLLERQDVGQNDLFHTYQSTKCLNRLPSDRLARAIAIQLCQVSDFHNVNVDHIPPTLNAISDDSNPFRKTSQDTKMDVKPLKESASSRNRFKEGTKYCSRNSKSEIRRAKEWVTKAKRLFLLDVERRAFDSIFVLEALVPSIVINEDICAYYESWITAEVEGDNLFGKILLDQSFDDLLLVDKKGNVLFQSGDSGLQFARADKLISRGKVASGYGTQTLKFVSANGKDIGDLEPRITIGDKEGGNILNKVPAREEVVIGDKNLLVFATPVNLPLRDKEQEMTEAGLVGRETSYILVGLIDKDRFRNETWQLSPSILLLLLLIVLLTLLALPLLKLLLLAPQDQWTVKDFALVVGASIIGTGLLTLSLVDSGAFWRTKRMVDDELKAFARSMHDHAKKEIDAALKTLAMYDAHRTRQIDPEREEMKKMDHDLNLESGSPFSLFGEPCLAKKKRYIVPQNKLNILADTKFADAKAQQQSLYQSFDSVFWVNCGGRLVDHWDVRTKDNYYPPIVPNLSDRAYFSKIVGKQSWQRSMETVENKEESKTPFILEPLFSRVDGSNTAVLAIQSKVQGSGEHDITIAGLDSRFLSLFDPIIPPGTGFAVVDQMSGKVLFHSEGQRNLREHFFEEIDNNKKLKALIAARAQGCEDGTYGGNAHRFCIREFNDIPWALVVFKNMEPLRTANLQAVTVACFLFAIYALAVLIILIWGLVVAKMRRQTVPVWLWPAEKRYDSYTAGASVTLFLFTLGLLSLWLFPPHYAFVIGVIILPILGAIATFVLLKWPTIPEKRPYGKDVCKAYLALCGSGLVLCSMLPSAVCMMLSYETEQTLLLKAGSLDLAKSFARSADQIREKYQYHDNKLIQHRLYGTSQVSTDPDSKWCPRRVDNAERLDVHLMRAAAEFKPDKFEPNKEAGLSAEWNVCLEERRQNDREGYPPNEENKDWFEKVYRFFRVPYNEEFTRTHGLFSETQQSEDVHKEVHWYRGGNGFRMVSYRPVYDLKAANNVEPSESPERWNVAINVPTWRMRLPAVFLLSLVLGVASFGLRKPLTRPKVLLSEAVIVLSAVVIFLLLWPGETLLIVWILASVLLLIWWFIHVLPGFVARRVFLLDLFWHDPNYAAFADRLQLASSPAKTEFKEEYKQVFEREFRASERLSEEIGRSILKDEKKRADFLWAARSEGFEPEPVGVFALDEARHYYGSVWEAMDKDEKMALFHLARNGFIVGTHPSLLSLIRKGWITRSPQLQFVNDSFRLFVFSRKDEILALQQEFDKGVWDQLVWPVGIGMMFVLAGLMYTQQELLASATAFIGILGGLVPVLSKLFDLFRTQKSGSLAP